MRKKRKNLFKNILNRFGLFHKDSFRGRNAIHFFNVSQFLGVINDNAFKFLIVFLFIDIKGQAVANEILFWVGVIYVIPFLLFSPAAGVLADRFSKQRLVIILKFSEVLIMGLGIIAFLCESEIVSYTLLFFLALQSAAFGPTKYSIIPELVKSDKIPRANGLVTAFTYLGIILGTFLASFMTQITGRNFPLTAVGCFLISVVGFVSSLFLIYTKPLQSTRTLKHFFLKEIYRNLRYANKFPFLLSAIFGSASFMFIGAYFQLNIVPFALQSLDLSEVGGGYLFLWTAIGIAAGAIAAGRISRKNIEIGLSCLAGMFFSLVLFLASFTQSLTLVLAALFALGFFGGLYIIPFDSYIQKHSPDERRGQIVAASNFLSFGAVLIAPLLLYFFGDILGLSAATGFTIMSILIFIMVLAITAQASNYFFNTITRYFVCPFYRIEIQNPHEMKEPCVFAMETLGPLPLSLISSTDPELHFYIPRTKRKFSDFFIKMLSSVNFIYVEDLKEGALRAFIQGLKKEVYHHGTPCLLLPNHSFIKDQNTQKLLKELQKTQAFDLKFVTVKKISRKSQFKKKFFKRPIIQIVFTEY